MGYLWEIILYSILFDTSFLAATFDRKPSENQTFWNWGYMKKNEWEREKEIYVCSLFL